MHHHNNNNEPKEDLNMTIRSRLLTTTAMLRPVLPQQNDHAQERIEVAKAYLNRWPAILANPFDRSVIWVESEPDDWREFIEYAIQTSGIPKIKRNARRLN
jgi:hypothetical protein